jgi:hypothetical protein
VQPWNSATLQAQFRDILTGNQEGFITILRPDTPRNSASLQITEIVYVGVLVSLTMVNHNLDAVAGNISGDFIIIENAQGINGLNGNIYEVAIVVDKDTINIIVDAPPTGVYTGGGTVARISRIDIYTKQYNFYMNQGRNLSINKVDFYVDKTEDGEVTVDYFTSSSNESQLNQQEATNSTIANGILETRPYEINGVLQYPYEQTMERLWHPMYVQADGECIQLRIFLNNEQMRDSDIAWSDFELNAMTFYAQPTTNRMQ